MPRDAEVHSIAHVRLPGDGGKLSLRSNGGVLNSGGPKKGGTCFICCQGTCQIERPCDIVTEGRGSCTTCTSASSMKTGFALSKN